MLIRCVTGTRPPVGFLKICYVFWEICVGKSVVFQMCVSGLIRNHIFSAISSDMLPSISQDILPPRLPSEYNIMLPFFRDFPDKIKICYR